MSLKSSLTSSVSFEWSTETQDYQTDKVTTTLFYIISICLRKRLFSKNIWQCGKSTFLVREHYRSSSQHQPRQRRCLCCHGYLSWIVFAWKTVSKIRHVLFYCSRLRDEMFNLGSVDWDKNSLKCSHIDSNLQIISPQAIKEILGCSSVPPSPAYVWMQQMVNYALAK